MAVVEKQAIACVGSSLVGHTQSGKSRHMAGVYKVKAYEQDMQHQINQQFHWNCTTRYHDAVLGVSAVHKFHLVFVTITFGFVRSKGR